MNRAVPKQNRAHRTRELILSATLDLLDQSGIDKLSTNAIADTAGVNIATVYKYFPDKYEILRVLALHYAEKQSSLICDYLDSLELDTDIKTVCHGLVDALVDGTRGDRAMVQLQRALIVVPELLEAYRDTNLEIAGSMKRFIDHWGIPLKNKQLNRAMRCVGEAWGALQDLALHHNPNYDQGIINELKIMITAYYEYRSRHHC